MTQIAVLNGIIVALITLAGTLGVAKMGARTTREGVAQTALQATVDQLQEEVASYRQEQERLREHVTKIESRLDEVSRLSRKAVTFIDRVGLSITFGRPLPRPDGVLADAVDMSLWPAPAAQSDPEQ